MTAGAGEFTPLASRAGALLKPLALYSLEMAVFLPLFLLYYILRGFPEDRVESSTRNALHIVDFERGIGVFWEVDWQQAAMNHQWLVDIANFTYLYLHQPVLFLAGFAFFATDLRKYRVLRNALLFSGFAAFVFYQFAPVTPPRLMADAGHDLGFVDTIEGLRRAKPGPLANDYAAIPSYHFGWILLAAFGAWWCWRSRAVRVASLAFAAVMWWAIVVTGNHYFADMVLGATMVLLALGLALAWERWMERSGAGWRPPAFRFHGLRLPF